MLGVTIDQHLNWKSNNEKICKKIVSGASALRHLKDFVDKKTFYNAIVKPHFDYCCDVFGETHATRLQKLQNRAARILTGLPNDTKQEILLNSLG